MKAMKLAAELVTLMIAASLVHYSYREIRAECAPYGEPFDARSFALDLSIIFSGTALVLVAINLAAWWLR